MANIVRFLHSADLHLDSPLRSLASRNSELATLLEDASRTVLCRLVDTAIEEAVDAVLIAGDLFDGELRDVRTAKLLERELQRLADVNIPVFIIWGNHDAEAKLGDVLDLPANVHTFDGRGGSASFADDQAVVHGVSFAKRKAPDSLLPKFSPPAPGCFNIGMLHTSLTGSEGHNSYAPCTVQELIDMGYDYWALGHIHKRKVHHPDPAIVMPGNPLGRHINESGERSISLVSLEQGKSPEITTVSIAPVRFERISVALDGIDERRDAFDLITDTIEQFRENNDVDHLIVRVELIGATSVTSHYHRNKESVLIELRLRYEHRDDLWIDSLDTRKLCAAESNSHNTKPAVHNFISSLQTLINEELLSSPNLRDSIHEDLDKLTRALPGELNDMFESELSDSQSDAASKLVHEGRDWILHQLNSESEDSSTDELS
jgi:DNA repair exonuclease SbcCD nuclease subunit